ncbi:hypothetical protein CGK50_24765, partial [Vibrio parahaemolyticus]
LIRNAFLDKAYCHSFVKRHGVSYAVFTLTNFRSNGHFRVAKPPKKTVDLADSTMDKRKRDFNLSFADIGLVKLSLL